MTHKPDQARMEREITKEYQEHLKRQMIKEAEDESELDELRRQVRLQRRRRRMHMVKQRCSKEEGQGT